MKSFLRIALALLCLTASHSAMSQVGCWKMATAGKYSMLALKADGTLWACGYNHWGELGDGTGTPTKKLVQLGSSSNWEWVSAGYRHTVALKKDGTLWAWGANSSGQLGDGSTSDRIAPIQIGSASNWKTASAGDHHTAAIKDNGTLWAWGNNNSGEIGDSTTTRRKSPVQIGTDTNWQSVSAGSDHTVAIRKDGTLWAWGSNNSGRLGDSTTIDRIVPVQIGSTTKWKFASAGSGHTVAIKVDGTVWAWGSNSSGQVGDGTGIKRMSPVQIGSDTSWSTVRSRGNYSLAIKKNGTLWSWGQNEDGQLGDNSYFNKNTPVQVDSNCIDVGAGHDHAAAIKLDRTLWTWGKNDWGQLGDGSTMERNIPLSISCPLSTPVVTSFTPTSATAGSTVTIKGRYLSGTVLVSFGGTFASSHIVINDSIITARVRGGASGAVVVTTGSGAAGLSGFNYVPVPYIYYFQPAIAVGGDVVTIKGKYFTAASAVRFGGVAAGSFTVLNDSTIKAVVKQNSSSGLISVTTPVGSCTKSAFVYASGCWKMVSAGDLHTVAIKVDGTLWAWGYNHWGQVGDGTNVTRRRPVKVGTDTDWQVVSAKYGHTIALKKNGTLWAWGYNVSGELGDGTTINRKVPVQIGSDSTWMSIDAGDGHTTAIRSDGTLWAWGNNRNNQLGDGSSSNKNTPVQVGSSTSWQSVTAGFEHTLALRTDGTLWGWGDNSAGTLGDGTIHGKDRPFQIGFAADWKSVSTGYYHTIAMKLDGTLWGWGININGQVGNGISSNGKASPTQVGTEKNWQSISTGYQHTEAIRLNNTLWGWGDNGWGQVGILQNTFVPQHINPGTYWRAVSAGDRHTTAIDTIGDLWVWGSNQYGQLGNGSTGNTTLPASLPCTYIFPLKFTSFLVINDRSAAKLFWSTANEENVSKYFVQFSSDGQDFQNVAEVPAKNRLENQYEFVYQMSPDVTSQTVYFRIVGVDLDAKRTYSEIRSIQMSFVRSSDIVLAPNPVSNVLYLYTTANAGATILIDDSYGRNIKNLIIKGGLNTLDVSGLSKGFYYISLIGKEGKIVRSFLKQ